MIKRIFSVIILCLCCFIFSGCDKKSPYLTFNPEPITQKTFYNAQKVFKPNDTIHFALLMPKGFKNEYLRLQIVKHSDKVSWGGNSIYMSRELWVDTSKKYYIDKFVIRQEGYYIVRFFYGNRTDKPIIERELWVKY